MTTQATAASSTSHLNPVPQATGLLNEKGIKALEADVAENRFGRLRRLANCFAVPFDHPFLQHKPAIALLFSDLMISAWRKSNKEKTSNESGNDKEVVTHECVQKVIVQFLRYKVFCHKTICEELILQCSDGPVRCNVGLFLFCCQQLQDTVAADKQLDLKRHPKRAVEVLKQFLYTGRFPDCAEVEKKERLQIFVECLQLLKELQRTDLFPLIEEHFIDCIKKWGTIKQEEVVSMFNSILQAAKVNTILGALLFDVIHAAFGLKIEHRFQNGKQLIHSEFLSCLSAAALLQLPFVKALYIPLITADSTLLYPGKTSEFLWTEGNWKHFFVGSNLRRQLEYKALDPESMIQEFALLGDVDGGLRLSLHFHTKMEVDKKKEVDDYFRRQRIILEKFNFDMLNLIMLGSIDMIRRAFEILKQNTIPANHLKVLQQIIDAGRVIDVTIDDPENKPAASSSSSSFSSSSSSSSTVSQEAEKMQQVMDTATYLPSDQATLIANALSQVVQGVYISSTEQYDAICQLEFMDEEIRRGFTYFFFDATVPKEMTTLLTEVIMAACPKSTIEAGLAQREVVDPLEELIMEEVD